MGVEGCRRINRDEIVEGQRYKAEVEKKLADAEEALRRHPKDGRARKFVSDCRKGLAALEERLRKKIADDESLKESLRGYQQAIAVAEALEARGRSFVFVTPHTPQCTRCRSLGVQRVELRCHQIAAGSLFHAQASQLHSHDHEFLPPKTKSS